MTSKETPKNAFCRGYPVSHSKDLGPRNGSHANDTTPSIVLPLLTDSPGGTLDRRLAVVSQNPTKEMV